jgi:drug/metabolite transporter (DMT)-like permease
LVQRHKRIDVVPEASSEQEAEATVRDNRRLGERSGTILAVAGAVLISASPVFVHLTTVPATSSAFWRVAIGGVLLAAWVLARRDPLPRGRRALLTLVGAGAFFALDLAFWHRSIPLVGPGLATLLANFQVLFVAVAGVLWLGERLRWQLVVAVPLGLLGVALVVGVDAGALDNDATVWGVAFGLGTALWYTLFLLSLRAMRVTASRTSPASELAVVSLASAVFLLVAAHVEGVPLTIPSARDAWLLGGYAIGSQVIGWVLITTALGLLPASRVGVILLLQPILALTWDVALFRRPFAAGHAAGAGLALLAIFLVVREQPRSRP